MSSAKIITNVIIVILVIAGIYFGYTFISSEDSAPVGVYTVGNDETSNQTITTENSDPFSFLLDGIDQVTLQQKSLLANPIFKDKLKDFGKKIELKDSGRRDPFSPISNSGGNYKYTPSTETSNTSTNNGGIFGNLEDSNNTSTTSVMSDTSTQDLEETIESSETVSAEL